MTIDSADVRAITFERATWGRRGYDEDQVDEYLEMVADELSRLRAENVRANALADSTVAHDKQYLARHRQFG